MTRAFDAHGDASDEELLARFAAGDRVAARALTLRLTPLALRVARRMLNDADEAEDVAQEAMVRLWRMAADWRPGQAQVTTWLYRVAMNLAIDRLRRGRRNRPLDAVDEPEDGRPAALETMIEADRARALGAALMRLPDRQRQAVVLRHLEGRANPEIAETMEIGVEAVESLVARGKRGLMAVLDGRRAELGYDDG